MPAGRENLEQQGDGAFLGHSQPGEILTISFVDAREALIDDEQNAVVPKTFVYGIGERSSGTSTANFFICAERKDYCPVAQDQSSVVPSVRRVSPIGNKRFRKELLDGRQGADELLFDTVQRDVEG